MTQKHVFLNMELKLQYQMYITIIKVRFTIPNHYIGHGFQKVFLEDLTLATPRIQKGRKTLVHVYYVGILYFGSSSFEHLTFQP